MTKSDILAAALVGGYPAGFRIALKLVLDWECELNHVTGEIEWENVEHDNGGATFAGLLAKPVYEGGDNLSADPTPREIVSIYYQNYWQKLSGLPVLVQETAFFMGVNIGIGAVIKYLQLALNDYGAKLVTDCKLGDQTRMAAFANPDPDGLCMAMLAKIRRHYDDIVAENPSQSVFLPGWKNRLDAAKSLLT